MKKRGFTLIELMVVVALIAGISVVAIVSLTGIADKRKEEEWENTKSLIETAAKNYYNANEYMFEGNGSKDLAEAYVTVGKLVDEGYLNKVTNPMTNQAVGYCNQVKITVNEGKARFKYEDKETEGNKESCNYTATNDELEIRSSKNISATVVYRKASDNTKATANGDWFNAKSLDAKGRLKLCIKTKTDMTTVTIDGENITTRKSSEYCRTTTYGDQKYENKEIYIEDSNGEYWRKYISFNVDSLVPSCEVNFSKNTLGENGWHTSPVTVTAELKGEKPVSEIDTKLVSTSKDGKFKKEGKQDTDTTGTKWHGQITSNANNVGTCNADVKLDSKDPTCEVEFKGTPGNAGWYKSDVTVTVKATSKPISGIQSGTSKVSSKAAGPYEASGTQGETTSATWYGTYKNGAGMSAACTSTVKVDKTPPSVTNVTIGSSKSGYNSNNAKGFFIVKDSTSGIGTVSSNYANSNSGNSSWPKNGAKEWDYYNGSSGFPIKLSNSLDGSEHKLTISATDIAGNSGSGTSGKYVVYKECSGSTTPSTTYGNYGSCNKYCGGGKKSRTKTVTNKDSKTGTICSTDPPTTDTADCNTGSCKKTAKAFRWDYSSRDCSGNGSVNFTTAATSACTSGTTNCKRKGPYRKYEFTELKIDCEMDAKSGKISASYKDITANTHKYLENNKRHSYIFYYDNTNGKTACNTDGAGSGKYVYQVCQHNDIARFHGVNWSSGNANNIWVGQAWYSDSYRSHIDKSKSSDEAAQWACEEKY